MKLIIKVLIITSLFGFLACGSESTPTVKEPALTENNVKKETKVVEQDEVTETEKPLTATNDNISKEKEMDKMEAKVEKKTDEIKSETKKASTPKVKKETVVTPPSKPVAPVEKPEIVKNTPVPTPVSSKPEIVKTNVTPPSTPKVEKPSAPKPEKPKKVIPPAPAELSHSAWDALLRKNVSSSGVVNYKAFKANKSALDAYTKYLADNPIQNSWSRQKKMAYWINAYNAFTVKLIVDNYPLESITKLEGGKPWDKKWIKLGGKTYSLNNIENDILRPQYKDARIHFAVNCAAKSCPPILNKAWTAKNLESNFQKQAKAFINNSSHNSITADKVTISKIFDWYKEDFGNIIDYLNKYANTKINPSAKVEYKDYNWSLNQ